MGTGKAGCDEKRLPAFLGGGEALDRFPGDAAIGVGFVLDIGSLERRAARAWLAAGIEFPLVGEVSFFAGELAAVRAFREFVFDYQVLEVRDRERVRIAVIAMADVEHLAERLRAVAVLGEVLWQGDGVGDNFAQIAVEVVESAGG